MRDNLDEVRPSTTGGIRVLLGHGSVYVMATGLQMVSGLLVLPIVTRLLGPVEYGVATAGLVLLQLILVVMTAGLPLVITRSFFKSSASEARRVAGLVVGLALVTALLADLTGPWWSQVFSSLRYGGALRLAVWSAVPMAVITSVQSYLRAAQRPGRFLALAAGATLGAQSVGLLAVALVGPATATTYLTGLLVGLGATAGLALGMDTVRLPFALGRRGTSEALRIGLPTVVHSMAFYLLALVDRILVERDLGLAATGRYQVAYLVGAVGVSVLAGLNNAWAPQVLGARPETRWELVARTTRPVMLLAAALVAVTAFLAPVGLRLAAPSSFEPTDVVGVTVLVAVVSIPYAVYLANVHVLFDLGRTGALMWITPFAVLVKIGLTIALLGPLGLPGAAVATVAAYTVLAALVAVRGRRLEPIPWSPRTFLVPGVLAVGAAGIAVALPSSGWGWQSARALAAVAVIAGVASIVLSRAGYRTAES